MSFSLVGSILRRTLATSTTIWGGSYTKSGTANASSVVRKLFFHAYSIWLFTRSDLKTIVVPQSAFGIINALARALVDASEPRSGSPSQSPTASMIRILSRTPLVVLWVWLNLLPFAIDNQRRPSAIVEDRHNKPWRTMPSGRMTAARARTVMFLLYAVAFATSMWWLRAGVGECLGLMVLGFCYNELKLADISWVTRNLVNAAGFCCFASGALRVATANGADAEASGCGYEITKGIMTMWADGSLTRTFSSTDASSSITNGWLCIIAGVVFSTVQTQDMADQVGDAMRGRWTMPLSLGDGTARWLTAAPMVLWSSVVCPAYWGVGPGPRALVASVGIAVAARTLMFRTVDSDKVTFRLWNLWMACVYLLPLVAAAGF